MTLPARYYTDPEIFRKEIELALLGFQTGCVDTEQTDFRFVFAVRPE